MNSKEIEMKNISVFIEGTAKKTFRFKKPIVTYGTRLAAKEVTVFWNFKNITSTIGNNTYGIKGSTDKTINDGYYDFQGLKSSMFCRCGTGGCVPSGMCTLGDVYPRGCVPSEPYRK